jgi:hypothetical protein
MRKHHEFAVVLDVLSFEAPEEAVNLPSDDRYFEQISHE